MMKYSAVLLVSVVSAASVFAAEKKGAPDRQKLEEMTRLQIFLDRANFGPGKIDGRGGEFTEKALEKYREAKGGAALIAEAPADQQPKKASKKDGAADAKIDTTGLDLSSVGEPFVQYTVAAEDLQNVGDVPKEPAAMAKLKSVPYRSVVEGVAEKFHSDIDFIKELNPTIKGNDLKEGDAITVPNVEPFDLAAVKKIKPGEATAGNESDPQSDTSDTKTATNDEKSGSKKGDAKEDAKSDKESAPSVALHISTKDKMIEVHEGDKLVAAFPVTPGSDDIPTPVGNWKIKGVAKMPEFRHDEKMLKEGERSENAHMIPPGPNNPVGVMWIALNKKGIGIHGTDDPDTIGRAASHGCIRLANWDVVKLAKLVKAGVPVTIE